MLLGKRASLRSQPEWIQQGIKLGNAFHYRQKNPVIHNSLNISASISILTFIGGLFWLGTFLPPLLFIPLGAVGFGLSYFMLFSLIVHEASHNMFILLKSSKRAQVWNRFLGWVVCIPFRIEYIKHWEMGHKIHHFHPVEPHDPQNCPGTVYTGSQLFKYLAKVLLIPGYAILRADYSCPAEKEYGNNWWLTFGSVFVWILSISLETIYLSWAVAVAAFWGIQILVIVNTLKITMEHGGEIGRRKNPLLRSCSSFSPETFIHAL
ncbi:MAG: hypothetical protein HC770_02260 [Pseudanabaena sp. CRU_2_10]|nr:hypothetical protein [Pseudanabaena sp. CRU_2_10]